MKEKLKRHTSVKNICDYVVLFLTFDKKLFIESWLVLLVDSSLFGEQIMGLKVPSFFFLPFLALTLVCR